MSKTNGVPRKSSHYTAHPQKADILRLWVQHVSKTEIARRLHMSINTVTCIVTTALADGEIEERRIIHGENHG